MQKFFDDTAIMGCVRNSDEMEYRCLELNITEEMCIDIRRSRPSPQQSVSIEGVDVEVVKSYRYLGVLLDKRLDWSVNTDSTGRRKQTVLPQETRVS